MKAIIEEIGGCLFLVVTGKVLLDIMNMFYSLVGAAL